MQLAPDDPWAGYERTVVEIRRADGTAVVVRAAAPGHHDGWPWDSRLPVFVLTAWDPGSARPGVEVNRRRQSALEDDLRPLAQDMWSAVGVDPVTGYREEGVAVRGVAEKDILALGARYDQDAVFVWTADAWAIVACAGRRRVTSGWRLGSPDGPGA